MIQLLLDATTSTDPLCNQSSFCIHALRRITKKLLRTLDCGGGMALSILLLPLHDAGRRRPCKACWELYNDKWDTERRRLWDILPFIFDVPERSKPAT
jgi:hypothetical protein